MRVGGVRRGVVGGGEGEGEERGGRGRERLTAQTPRRMRWFQGRVGEGGTCWMAWAMRRMIVSASLSSWKGGWEG